MSRGVSYGGGQSSLGYLFGSGEKKPIDDDNPPPPTSKLVYPPYGIDKEDEIMGTMNSHPQNQDQTTNNCLGVLVQNSGKTIIERPTTKVNSVPGGNSSLGYLFGDK